LMLEPQRIEPGVSGRSRRAVDRRVAFGKRDDFRRIRDERQEFAESPNAAAVERVW